MATSKGHYMGVPVWLKAVWLKYECREGFAILHSGQRLPESWATSERLRLEPLPFPTVDSEIEGG
jgi:hypothetical protein